MEGFGFPNDDFNLGREDLGISFGDDAPPPKLEQEKTPGQVQSHGCMCYFSLPKDIVDWIPIIASPLTTPPQTPPVEAHDPLPTPTPKLLPELLKLWRCMKLPQARRKDQEGANY